MDGLARRSAMERKLGLKAVCAPEHRPMTMTGAATPATVTTSRRRGDHRRWPRGRRVALAAGVPVSLSPRPGRSRRSTESQPGRAPGRAARTAGRDRRGAWRRVGQQDGCGGLRGTVCRLREDAEEGAALAELNERFGHTADERIRSRAAVPVSGAFVTALPTSVAIHRTMLSIATSGTRA